MKLTIRKHNEQFLTELAESLDVNNSEALNFLLLTLKSQGYRIGANFQPHQSNTLEIPATPVTPVIDTTVTDFGFTDTSPLMEEIDPIIARLVNLGLCEQNF